MVSRFHSGASASLVPRSVSDLVLYSFTTLAILRCLLLRLFRGRLTGRRMFIMPLHFDN